MIELTGNRVRIEGMTFSLDSPLIATPLKSTIFFGLHEVDEREMLNRWLPKDLAVVELGAGIGVVSCLTNRKLARPQDHVVLEVNPPLVPLLERNRKLNDCQFGIINKGLSYDSETVELSVNQNFVGTRRASLTGLQSDGNSATTFIVPATTLKSIIETAGMDQIALICDIEGTELALVEREIDTIRQHVRFILVELHPRVLGLEATTRIIDTLVSAGFTLRDSSSDGLRPFNVVLTRD
jgi:FkbM family methyltransferase